MLLIVFVMYLIIFVLSLAAAENFNENWKNHLKNSQNFEEFCFFFVGKFIAHL